MLLQEIKGLGQKRIEKLNAAGITSPVALVTVFPYKYVDVSKAIDATAIQEGQEISFKAMLTEKPVLKFVRKGLNFIRANFVQGKLTLHVLWFNQRFIISALKENHDYNILGRVKRICKNGVIEITATKLILKDSETGLIPLYRLPLPENVFISAVTAVLNKVRLTLGLPKGTAEKYGLTDLNQAVRAMHFPQNMEEVRRAQETLALEHLSNIIARFKLIKETSGKNKVFRYSGDKDKVNKVIHSLPFALTEGQQKALSEILEDMDSPQPMNRLLQGDVGSGKTIIALLAMYYAVLSGYQSVFMAPTEILARQHYLKAAELFSPLGLNVAYLSSGIGTAERENALFDIKYSAHMVFGTHALYGDDVVFNKLSLIVTDEQQRFGVTQRGKLDNKSDHADSLILSATPIPRTLALTFYGQLKQSALLSVWENKAQVITKIVPEHKTEDMYRYLLEKARGGEQSYIVCPRITDDEESDLMSVDKVFKYLSAKKEFSGLLARLTGDMKEKEKTAVMQDFHSGKSKILIATSVIEVGVDNQSATSMVIFDADRFGLSQLHQLRGRVGRGRKLSYCFLLSSGESSAERLKFLTENSDGFKIADFDFESRGAGDFIGARQHGESTSIPDFKITASVLEKADAIAGEMLSDADVRAALTESFTKEGYNFMKCIVLN